MACRGEMEEGKYISKGDEMAQTESAWGVWRCGGARSSQTYWTAAFPASLLICEGESRKFSVSLFSNHSSVKSLVGTYCVLASFKTTTMNCGFRPKDKVFGRLCRRNKATAH